MEGHKCSSIIWPFGTLTSLAATAVITASVTAELQLASDIGVLPVRKGWSAADRILVLWKHVASLVDPTLSFLTLGQCVSRCSLYADMTFVHVARDCGSMLWWPGIAGLLAHFGKKEYRLLRCLDKVALCLSI